MADKFYVWRRNDGYVDATANRMPQGWRTPAGKEFTFEQLKVFDQWGSEIVEFIEQERSK